MINHNRGLLFRDLYLECGPDTDNFSFPSPKMKFLKSGLKQHYSSQSIPQLGLFKLPHCVNEPMQPYGPGTKQRLGLHSTLMEMKAQILNEGPFDVPLVISGEAITTKDVQMQVLPTEHGTPLCKFSLATKEIIEQAIQKALKVKPEWEAMPFNDRAAIFLKAADLISTKYRYKIMAATMLGQGKNIWQAEIDAAAELADFFRFNATFAQQLYQDQPPANSPLMWNRLEYRPLEGFVTAISPFNFTAIGGNLAGAPALMVVYLIGKCGIMEAIQLFNLF